MIKPFMNNCLIEIIREDDGISRADENETKNKGTLLDFSIAPFHLTASSGYQITDNEFEKIGFRLTQSKGKMVRWEEFAEGGQTFEEDGKSYALIPWWRIIGIEE